MTHSVYVRDPDGNSVEILYDLPPEVWSGDVNAALNYFEFLPAEGAARSRTTPSTTGSIPPTPEPGPGRMRHIGDAERRARLGRATTSPPAPRSMTSRSWPVTWSACTAPTRRRCSSPRPPA